MQFNSHSSAQDCVSEILKICGATTATYPLVDITRRFNGALDDYFSLAFESDARWTFDDLNQTSPPLETINLVSGTQRYELDDFTSEIINVLRVEAKDASGNWVLLKPIQDEEIGAQALPEFMDAGGNPTYYRKFGEYLYLYPAPNYNSTNGLALYFERPASRMASTDTTKVPGVPTMHHMALCRMAALPFLIEKGLPQTSSVSIQIQNDKEIIANHFSRRDKDAPTKIKPKYRSSK